MTGVHTTTITETYLRHAVYRVCTAGGLAPSSWHTLRHTYATHAERFGVSSWALQAWLGHSSITMTEKYVTLANRLGEIIPDHVVYAGSARSRAARAGDAGRPLRRSICNAIATGRGHRRKRQR